MWGRRKDIGGGRHLSPWWIGKLKNPSKIRLVTKEGIETCRSLLSLGNTNLLNKINLLLLHIFLSLILTLHTIFLGLWCMNCLVVSILKINLEHIWGVIVNLFTALQCKDTNLETTSNIW
jgi:hypothetical protein